MLGAKRIPGILGIAGIPGILGVPGIAGVETKSTAANQKIVL